MTTPVVQPNIHLASGWATHVNSDGSQIAPPGTPDPVGGYGMVQGLPGDPTAALFWMGNPNVANPAYACVEYYIKMATQANSGRLVLDFDLTPGADFVANAWIKETDTKFVKSGKMFNLSLQRIMKTNGIQISNQPGSWVDTGFTAPPFVAGVPLHHKYIYGFDIAKDLYGIQEIIIGGVQFLVPFVLEDISDLPTTWADGAYFQNQDQVGPNGGTQRYYLDNVNYTWS
jgi:hypothetical protein